jgi:hypothetical protein
MSRKNAKQIVYRYNGVESSDEVEVDYDGDVPTPRTGDILSRKGKNWKAVHIITETSGSGAIPVLRVFLTDQL